MLESKTSLYLSGERAEELGRLLEQALRVIILGKGVGEASAFKMCFAGFNKGLVALFLEIVTAADRIGRREMLLHSLEDFYPGLLRLYAVFFPPIQYIVREESRRWRSWYHFCGSWGRCPQCQLAFVPFLNPSEKYLRIRLAERVKIDAGRSMRYSKYVHREAC